MRILKNTIVYFFITSILFVIHLLMSCNFNSNVSNSKKTNYRKNISSINVSDTTISKQIIDNGSKVKIDLKVNDFIIKQIVLNNHNNDTVMVDYFDNGSLYRRDQWFTFGDIDDFIEITFFDTTVTSGELFSLKKYNILQENREDTVQIEEFFQNLNKQKMGIYYFEDRVEHHYYDSVGIYKTTTKIIFNSKGDTISIIEN